MKKLLITTMAAVSVGLCAKAADAIDASTFTENGTSFDDLTTGADFAGDNNFWQTPEGEGDLFKIIDVVYPEGATPQHWALATQEKALSIDTATPIFRNVNPVSGGNPPLDVSKKSVFFDSVVQFTATDVAPSMENNTTDKLAVWLYQSPEDVSGRLFEEESAITELVITAADSSDPTKTKHYPTGISVDPDSWHRLTIKSFNDEIGDLFFNVWVDKTQVKVGDTVNFKSLIDDTEDTTDGCYKLQGVAFDGKGAVDDIVFTTTEPEFAKESEAEKVNVSVTINDFAAIMMALFDGSEVITSGSASYEFEKGSTHSLQFMLNEGYELVSSSPVASNEGGYYTITVEPNSDVNVEIVVRKAGGGDVVTYPTVKPNGDSTTQETLSASAVAAIEAALAGVETMPDALTVIVNEKEYFGDEAVAKINEVVEMFEAAEEGATLKFFNDEGEMIVSFKAKNPFMETETAEATDYEAMVGESVATVTSKYTVNKETVDLTPGVGGENEAVTFKLVIKPVGSTGSDTGSEEQN